VDSLYEVRNEDMSVHMDKIWGSVSAKMLTINKTTWGPLTPEQISKVSFLCLIKKLSPTRVKSDKEKIFR
jgi:hypothetical protein